MVSVPTADRDVITAMALRIDPIKHRCFAFSNESMNQ